MPILIHYAEIAIKGRNRSFFVKRLAENIEKKLSVKVVDENDRLVIDSEINWENAKNALRHVFGIAWFARTHTCRPDMEEMKKVIFQVYEGKKPATVKIESARADKTFPVKSPEISRLLGEVLYNKGIKISMKPEEIIFVEVSKNNCYMFSERVQGLGGLPVGSSGRATVLFSGGIDSPVAAYLMMKRGCTVDLLHFHTFRSNEDVLGTKVHDLAKILSNYGNVKLYCVPFHNYNLAAAGIGSEDLVVFRRFMFRVAEALARRTGSKVLVTGDNIGQVASQTLDNMAAADDAVRMSIFRPVLTYNKQEIIDLAKRIGTYDVSIKPYKDCCSIVSRKPNISARMENICELESKININDIIEKTIKEAGEIKL